MAFSRWTGSAFTAVGLVRRWDGGAWVVCDFVRRWSGSAWENVWLKLAASKNFDPSVVWVNSPASMTPTTRALTTNTVVITAVGGAPGYTYSWARVSGDATITCNSPSAASTTFSATVTVATTKTAVWRCTVTDAVANVTTLDVTPSLVYDSGF